MSGGTPSRPSRWAQSGAQLTGAQYDDHFVALAAAGTDPHGEATLCARLVRPGARVLDAGCGTGRVAIRLAALGYRCVGIDNDTSLLDHARMQAATVDWIVADLSEPLQLAEPFDLVVAAGNVVPLVAPGTESAVLTNLSSYLVAGGLLVAGFGLDPDHLPLAEAPFGLAEYDEWCAAAGLVLQQRFSTWGGDAWDGGGYAVSLHRRGPDPSRSSVGE
jgi:SAM-dependent methyltransferase